MSTRMERVSGWLLGLVVAAALIFGASVAITRPAQAMSCPNDGWNTFGWQPNPTSCNSACQQVHQDGQGVWNPTTWCCHCLF